MKALTIRQPWAWAIALGMKRCENRTWSTSYRGPIAIHAGSSRVSMRDGLKFLQDVGLQLDAEALTFGAIIGVCELVDCRALDNGRQRQLFGAEPVDAFRVGPYCWTLANVRPLVEPIAIEGALGLWTVPARLATQLDALATSGQRVD